MERSSIKRSQKIGIIKAGEGSGTKEARNGKDDALPFNRSTKHQRLIKWDSEEGTVDPIFQDPVISDIPKPTKLDARAAERKSLPPFPHPMTRNYCAWSASTAQRYQRRNDE